MAAAFSGSLGTPLPRNIFTAVPTHPLLAPSSQPCFHRAVPRVASTRTPRPSSYMVPSVTQLGPFWLAHWVVHASRSPSRHENDFTVPGRAHFPPEDTRPFGHTYPLSPSSRGAVSAVACGASMASSSTRNGAPHCFGGSVSPRSACLQASSTPAFEVIDLVLSLVASWLLPKIVALAAIFPRVPCFIANAPRLAPRTKCVASVHVPTRSPRDARSTVVRSLPTSIVAMSVDVPRSSSAESCAPMSAPIFGSVARSSSALSIWTSSSCCVTPAYP